MAQIPDTASNVAGARQVASRPMPRYKHAASRPNQHLAPQQRWPYGQLEENAPPEAHLARALAQRLHQEKTGQTQQHIAQRAGITTDALSRLLRGETWGTLPILARLERALDANLWGNEHRTSPPDSEPPDPTTHTQP